MELEDSFQMYPSCLFPPFAFLISEAVGRTTSYVVCNENEVECSAPIVARSPRAVGERLFDSRAFFGIRERCSIT